MKVIKSESAPNCRPGEVWQKPTGEYRKFTGGGWVAPSDAEMAAIRAEKSAPELELTDEDSDEKAIQEQNVADAAENDRFHAIAARLEKLGFKIKTAIFPTKEISVESLDGSVGEKIVGLDDFEEFVNQLEIRAAKKELSPEDVAKLQEKKDQSSGAGGYDGNGSPVE